MRATGWFAKASLKTSGKNEVLASRSILALNNSKLFENRVTDVDSLKMLNKDPVAPALTARPVFTPAQPDGPVAGEKPMLRSREAEASRLRFISA